MDDMLEKIDLIRERMGVSYKEAKDALDQSQGNVLDAIILLEEKKEDRKIWTEQISCLLYTSRCV